MEFALDNTYTKDKDGNIFKQEVGIPMGDPGSALTRDGDNNVRMDGEGVDARG